MKQYKGSAVVKRTEIEIVDASSIVLARSAGKQLAKEIGFTLADQTRVATAISEIARNALQYAGTGTCIIWEDSSGQDVKITVLIEDKGPGIPDVAEAMKDGYSSGRGLGAGLPGARRLMQDFELQTRPGATKVTMSLSRRKMPPLSSLGMR